MGHAPATPSRISEIEAAVSARRSPVAYAVSWQEALSAAEGLLDEGGEQDATRLNRVNRLLDYAAGLPGADRVGIASTRAMAFIALQLPSDTPELVALESVMEAWLLTQNVRTPEFRAFLALGAGNFFTLLKDAALERRHIHAVHDAIIFAYDVFDECADGRTDLAVRLLSQVKLRLLQLQAVAPEDAVALHSDARRLAAAALAGQGAQENQVTRAICQEVAGLVAAADPEGPSSAAVAEAIAHLREAYGCFLREDGREEVEQCVCKILQLRSRFESPPSVAAVRALEQDLRALEWSYTGTHADEVQFPPGQFEVARSWLEAAHCSDGNDQEAAFERAAGFASRLANAPPDAVDSEMRMDAWFVLGNALGRQLLTASALHRLPAADIAETRQRLVAAQQAFGASLALLPQHDDPEMAARVRCQLAKALAAQLACCGDRQCFQAAKAAWRDAIMHADVDDLLRYRLNLAAVILANLDGDEEQDLDEVETLLDLLERAAVVDPEIEIEPAIRRSRALFDALMQQPDGPATAMDYQRAIRLAKDRAARLHYLAETLAALPDYSEARRGFLSAPYATVRAEREALRRSGLPERDPRQWQEIEYQADQVRRINDALLALDRKVNSAETGKALLASHLEYGTPFLLVLRSFDLESRFVDGPRPLRGEFSDILRHIEDQTSNLVISGHPLVRELVERVGSDCPTLLAMNVLDPLAPRAAAKLFVAPTNWRRLVFALAAQASAVTVFLSASDQISPGLSHELDALAELGEVEKTVVVIEPSLRAIMEAPAVADAAIIERTRQDLKARGFSLVVTEEELNADFDKVVGLLRGLLARSRPADLD